MGVTVVPETTDDAILTALLAVAGELHGTKIGLFTNNFTPSRGTPLSGFTQPTYPGYALQTIVWGAPSRNPAGAISATTGVQPFQMSDSTDPTTAYGVIIVDSTGATLILSALFDTPQQLADALSIINVVYEYVQTNLAQGNLYTVE